MSRRDTAEEKLYSTVIHYSRERTALSSSKPTDLSKPQRLYGPGPAFASLVSLLGEVTNEAASGACERTHGYDLASLACFRTLAQRCRCASAIRSRASLLKTRLPRLSLAPFRLPRALSAFPTRSISCWRREYSERREVTTL